MSKRHDIISEQWATKIRRHPNDMSSRETIWLVKSHEQLRRDLNACQAENARLSGALEQIANLTIADSRSTPVWVAIATEALRNGVES